MRVKDRPNLHAAEEAQEDVDGKDPSDGLLAIVRELVAAEIGVENTNGIHIPETSSHAAERSKDDEPGPQASLGILDVVLFLSGSGGSDDGAIARVIVGESAFFILVGGSGGLGTGGTRLEWRA